MRDLTRAFIAVTIPEPLAGLVAEVQQSLKNQGLRIAWVAPGNVHLTLKFLGDIEPADIDPVAVILSECAQRMAPLSLSAGGLGVAASEGGVDGGNRRYTSADCLSTGSGCPAGGIRQGPVQA